MSTLQENLDTIKLDKDTNLKPENLKKGITCLGITGTYEGSGGGTVEGIKQFATVEEMNNSTNNKEGDLAIVYRNEVQNATVDSQFQTATFPQTVILDTAITDYVEVRYRAVDSSKMFDCWGSLDSSMFMMDCYSETGEVRIEYTSSDGITYTRTDSTGNPVDFGCEIYYAYTEMWNDAIGKFIQVGGSTFEGLFNYLPIISDEIVTFGSVKYKLPKAIINYSETVNFNNKTNGLMFRTDSYVNNRANSIMKVNNYEEINGIRYAKSGSLYFIMAGYPLTAVITATNETRIAFTGYTGGTSSGNTTYVRKVDFDENGITNTTDYPTEQLPANFEALSVKGQTYYWDISAADDTAMKTYVNGINGDTVTIPQRGSSTVTLSYVSGNEYTPPVFNTNVLKWLYAPTQLTLAKANELLPGKISYGKNGVVTGDGSIYDDLDNSEIQTNVLGLKQIYPGEIFSYYGFNDTLHSTKISDKISPHKYTPIKQTNSINSNLDFTIGIDDTKCNKNIILSNFGEDSSNPWKRLYGYVKNNRYFGLYQANDSFKYKYAIFELFTDKEPVNILEWSSPLNNGSSYASDEIKYNVDGNVYIIYNTYNGGEPRFVLDRVDMNTQTKTTVINDTLPYYIKTGRRMEMYDRWILVTTVDKDLNHAHTYLYDTVDNIVRLDNEITGTSTFSNTSTIHVILDEDTNIYYLLLSSFNRIISIYSYNIEDGVLNNFTNIYTSSSGVSTLPKSGTSYGTLDGNMLVSYLGLYAINTKSGEVKVLTCENIPSVLSYTLFDYNTIKYSDYILSGITCTDYDLSNNTISLSYSRKYQTITYMAVKEYPNVATMICLENDDIYCIIEQLPYCRLKLQNYTISEDTDTYYFVTTVTDYDYYFGILFNTSNTITPTEYNTAIDTANEILGEEV